MAIMGYKLSDIAEDDVSDIFDYSKERHGKTQAHNYLTGLENRLGTRVQNPERGRVRNEIRAELRSYIYEHHVIFYRLEDTFIRIVRILHAKRDLPRSFGDGKIK